MIISDLKYVEDVVAQESMIVGSGGVKFDSTVKKDVLLKKKAEIDIKKNVISKVDVKGNLAELEGSADASGKNTLAELNGFTQTEPGYSAAFLESTSATLDY
jgi:hypothetical protein